MTVKDLNSEPNLAEWQQTVKEIIDSPRVSRYLEVMDKHAREYTESLSEDQRPQSNGTHKSSLYKTAELLLPEQDKSMHDYARDWGEVSRQHAENGLYKQAAEFFQPGEGLLVDLGCGTGRFLSEMSRGPAIGVDINHYCLQAAEQTLSRRGAKVKRYSRTYISFDPDRGFILKPYPVMEEVDLSGTVLLSDDIENLHNTKRVLYNQGRKADMISFTLSGGYTNNSPLQFIDFMRLGDNYWEKRKVEHGQTIADSVVDNLSKICKPGGRFFLATRLSIFDTDEKTTLDKHEEFGQEMANKHPNVDIVKTSSIPMMHEYRMNGISIDARLQLPDGTLKPADESMMEKPYRLYLLDMRVR